MRRLCSIALCAILAPAGAQAETVLVFAASSLKTALDEIAAGFAEATGHSATVSFAGSSALARQIQLGAPADVFLSANVAWMDMLEADGLIEPGTRRDLLGNALALIAADPQAQPVTLGPGTDLAGLLGEGRLAMALVEAVPAGIYGKAALENLGLWPSLAAQVAQTDNVRAALALVSSGEAPLGVVYTTDALADPSVTVVATFPPDSHPPITYPVAAISGRATPAVRAYLDYLASAAARAVFTRQGFRLPDGAGG